MARAAVTAPAYLSEVRSAASSAKIACDYVYSTATDAQSDCRHNCIGLEDSAVYSGHREHGASARRTVSSGWSALSSGRDARLSAGVVRRACPYHAWCVASNSAREGLMGVSGLSSLRHTGGRWRTTETLIYLGRRRGPCRWHRGTGAHWISSAGHFTVARAHRNMQAWACTQRIVHTP